ncbi:MAG: glucose-6-phosphate dehydrogenase [Planctomycetes bacterium]|nr:glucose-6-phosphate dehydrogenase [Planctomycetota bacterium]
MDTSDITVSARFPQGRARPFVMVIFGASGDLAHRKIMPAVYELCCGKAWPAKTLVVGYGRAELDTGGFRDGLRQAVREHARSAFDEGVWRDLAGRIHYHRGEYGSREDFERLRARLESLTAEADLPPNYLFYLSTPPGQFEDVIAHLGASGLARKGAAGDEPWSRVVIEKPFGRDLDSARRLNGLLAEVFDEAQVYRIDHYLGKETVQNLLVMRFANSVFEPIWNQKYIDHVQITAAETSGVGGRGSYYDSAGALRDMLQNHMMNLLCLVAMEAPASLEADAVRDEKVKVLRSLRPIPPDCAAFGVIRAQYGPGEADGRTFRDYTGEPGVAAGSSTETFIALKLNIDNWRWAEVPFFVRTGKALAQRVTEIVIQFKPVPPVLFNRPPTGPMQPNQLVVRVQPDEGISMRFQVKQPGSPLKIEGVPMHFGYAGTFGRKVPEAYERLILDAATGDPTLFIRSDEIEAAWSFVMPILAGCDRVRGRALPRYAPLSWGPREADDLIAAGGARWHTPAAMDPRQAQR